MRVGTLKTDEAITQRLPSSSPSLKASRTDCVRLLIAMRQLSERVQRLFIASMTFWPWRRPLHDEALKPVAEFKASFSPSVISMDRDGFSSTPSFSET